MTSPAMPYELTVDTETPKPLYKQVKDYVIKNIQSGDWPIHYQIPSEHTLVRNLKISRMTIHRALRELTQDGYLERVQGVGTFVSSKQKEVTSISIPEISRLIKGHGHKYSCDPHFLQKEPADQEIANKLNLKIGDPIYRSYFVHMQNNEPVMLEDRYTVCDLLPNLMAQDFHFKTMEDYFQRTCHKVSHAYALKAVLSSAEVMHFMKLNKQEACIEINKMTFAGIKVLSLAKLTLPSGRFQLSC